MLEVLFHIFLINTFVIFYLTFVESGITSYVDYIIRYISYRIGIYSIIDKVFNCVFCLSMQVVFWYLLFTQDSIYYIFLYLMIQFAMMKFMVAINNYLTPDSE